VSCVGLGGVLVNQINSNVAMQGETWELSLGDRGRPAAPTPPEESPSGDGQIRLLRPGVILGITRLCLTFQSRGQ
jgi:hypothetical protein